MLLNNYFTEIQEAAEASSEEICGFLLVDGMGSLVAYPTLNVAHSDRNVRFEISVREQISFYKTRRTFAIYHSHVLVDEKFSEEDIRTANMAEVPIMVYSKMTRRFNYYCPPKCILPYKERPFILGLQDCVTLVTDYYQKEYNFPMPFFVRGPAMLEEGFKDLFDYYRSCGFENVTRPQKGDILLLSILNAGHVNHAGIYLGDGVVLHQMMHRESCEQLFDESWLKRVRYILRRPNLY